MDSEAPVKGLAFPPTDDQIYRRRGLWEALGPGLGRWIDHDSILCIAYRPKRHATAPASLETHCKRGLMVLIRSDPWAAMAPIVMISMLAETDERRAVMLLPMLGVISPDKYKRIASGMGVGVAGLSG